ncbi:MAG: chemotaxis protein CheC [Thermoleophilia bacterium]
MSGDSLSQEQIDALLSGASPDELPEAPDPVAEAVARAEAAATAAPAEDVEADAETGAEAAADGEAAEGDVDADADAGGGDAEAGGRGGGPGGAAGSHTATAKGELTDLFEDLLTPEERDTLGEIGNISMASAATTLSTLLNNQVLITTPTVITTTEAHVVDSYDRPRRWCASATPRACTAPTCSSSVPTTRRSWPT